MYPAQPTAISTTHDGFLLVYSETHIDVFDASAGTSTQPFLCICCTKEVFFITGLSLYHTYASPVVCFDQYRMSAVVRMYPNCGGHVKRDNIPTTTPQPLFSPLHRESSYRYPIEQLRQGEQHHLFTQKQIYWIMMIVE
jgi:hypothetical protein